MKTKITIQSLLVLVSIGGLYLSQHNQIGMAGWGLALVLTLLMFKR